MQNTRQSKQSHKHTCRTQTPSHKVTAKGQTASEINIKRKSQYRMVKDMLVHLSQMFHENVFYLLHKLDFCHNRLSYRWRRFTLKMPAQTSSSHAVFSHCLLKTHYAFFSFFFLTEIKLWIVFPKTDLFTHTSMLQYFLCFCLLIYINVHKG